MKTRFMATHPRLWIWVAVALIAAATLVPRPTQGPSSAMTPWYCLLCGDQGLVDVLLNVALFVPLGLALGHNRWKPVQVLLLGALMATAIELLQATLVTGRDASLSDVVTDALGAYGGALMAAYHARLWQPGVAGARRLAVTGSLAWLGLTWGTSLAVQPDRPVGEVRPAVSPTQPLMQEFAGRVLASHATGPDVNLGSLRLEASVVTAGLTDRVAPILQLDDDSPLPLARLGQLGQKPTFSRRLLSTRWRLRTPMARAYGGVIPPGPVTATLAGGYHHATVWAAATRDGISHRGEIVLTPGIGWMLVLPLGYPFDVHADWTSAFWLATPLLILGFWVGRARVGHLGLVLGTAMLLAVGLAGPGTVMQVAPVAWPVWVLCVAAVVAGCWWSQRRRSATTTEP